MSIEYAEPGLFVFMQGRVYSYGPSWVAEIGMLREGETLEQFMKRSGQEVKK